MTIDNVLICLLCLITLMVSFSSTSSIRDIIHNCRCSREERNWKNIFADFIIILICLFGVFILGLIIYFQIFNMNFEESFNNLKNVVIDFFNPFFDFIQ